MNKLKKLRHLLLLPLLSLLMLPAPLRGAEQQEKITLNLNGVLMTQFFKEIEQRTTYKFFYKDSHVENASPVTINVREESLANILSTVFVNTSLAYEISGNQIVITQKEPR